VFYIFHLWKAFREYHFVLRGPIQNEQKLCFVQAKRLFCYHAREKMEMPVDPRNPMPKRLRRIFSQLCHKHVGSSSKMELVMEASCLHWKFRAHFQRFSLVPPWHVFLGKNDWLPFVRDFFLYVQAQLDILST
jgi:hypothetical protein